MGLAGVFEDRQLGWGREVAIGQDVREAGAQFVERGRRFRDGPLPPDHEGDGLKSVHFAGMFDLKSGCRN